MEEIVKQKMEAYNKLIVKWNMGSLFFNDPNIKDIVKLKHTISFESLCKDVEDLLKWFNNNNIKYSEEEERIGFNIEFRVLRMDKYKY
jgi:serine/threonine-protein kinase RIO1